MGREGGDWLCGACNHLNFKKRDVCQRCKCPPGTEDMTFYRMSARSEVLAGDWYCMIPNCGAHNYAKRMSCYRCGVVQTTSFIDETNCQLPPGWKSGDWICTSFGCGIHNYASRMECYQCKTSKPLGK
ncbi:zinc finger Ran-binding domain-containing protein 2-like [Impatiens glandulifera]|uniref:zinc finger Ran-binding domain-containing protein 2-like n=1 Tax=Impatiens glandulifera TaxID=253017 RepID=UPI001FB060F3|nr:zinc finger Ran-binding domain-containing protein 2-like [Impatiens glandulifera]